VYPAASVRKSIKGRDKEKTELARIHLTGLFWKIKAKLTPFDSFDSFDSFD
jgi:hypothetical protein